MPKITKYDGKDVIQAKTKTKRAGDSDQKVAALKWWTMEDPASLAAALFGTVRYLKTNQGWRQQQAALFARLYGNLPIWNFLGVNLTKLNAQYRFPSERPTMNVVQSCIDALVARLVQSKPKPIFLTSGGDYKKRMTAKQLNRFIDGEFYANRAYEVGETVLRDAAILGTGCVKVFEENKRVKIERQLCTEIFVDESDAMYGHPRQMHQLKIVDRDVAADMFPKHADAIMQASPAYFDSSTENRNSIASQIMMCESWHLKSGPDANDGKKVIAIDTAVLEDDEWDDEDFPFEFFNYAPRTLGFFAQGLAEQLMGIQNEINKLLYTIQQSLHLCGIPKWLVEDSSKVVSAHINNQIGGIIKYQGTPPVLQVSQVLPVELYSQLDRLVQYAYQQSGISQLAAASQKPAGLNSGKALREFDDIQSDRFANLSQRYERFYVEGLAPKMYRLAKKIAERDGKYSSVYPGKEGVEVIDFPKMKLKDDEFVIQAFPHSAYSNDPAQRKQEIVDDMQAGLLSPDEGRRLLDFPDLKQEQDLLNAAEERILRILDQIVEDGEFEPPDPDIDLAKAEVKVVQYINKFSNQKLEPARMQMLRDWKVQILTLKMAMQPPPPMGADMGAMPQAAPEAPPVSPMIPNVPMA